jgi:hypothetical protein
MLVWDKDSYTGIFLALLTYTCVLQPRLLHYFIIPIVVSASLRLLYLLLYSEHIIHIQILGFLPFRYSSHVCSPPSVQPMSNNVLHLFWVYKLHVILGLLSLANFD